MQLKRLEAYGFKSFADKIEIDFDQGITAIVGPNGSGKSNISDAIRWALGEQNVRNLRGTKAEDIIFTGSAARRALGVAEVSLIFENQGDMGVDFKEVAVTRRLFRSGESEFCINRSRCRLKDIHDLFADTGIGHDGMSIIGQNRIDDILNSKPEDRRAFFEETAGITKYRNRKQETLRKLKDTENNLVNLSGIQHELETHLEPLAEHAEKTRQFNALNMAYQKARLTGLSQKHEKLSATLRESGGKKQALADQAIGLRTEAQTAEAKREQLAKEAIDLERTVQTCAEANDGIRGELETVTARLAALKERQEQSGAIRERILAQRAEHAAEVEASRQDIAALEETEKQHREKLNLLENLLAEEREKSKQMEARIRAQKESSQAADDALRKKQQELTEKQQQLALVEHDISAQESGRAEQETIRRNAQEEWEKLQAEKSSMERDAAELDERKQRVSEEREEKRKAHGAAARALVQLREEEQSCRQRANAAETQMHYLQRLQQAYEGFGKAPRAVLTSKEPWRQGICGAVAELLDVPPDYVTAIEVALGGNVQNIVTEDTEAAKAAIQFLKRGRLGRVTFLPLSTITVREQRREAFDHAPGVIGYANGLVGAEPKYRKILDFLLGRTLVMDTLDHALALAKTQGYRLRIVTLEGELLAPGGALSGGSRHQREASFLNRTGEIATLAETLKKERAALSDCLRKRQERERERDSLAEALASLEDALQKMDVHRAEFRVSLKRIGESLDAKTQECKEMEQQAAERQQSFASMERSRVMLSRELEVLSRAAQEAEKAAQDQGILLEDYEQDAQDMADHVQEREIDRAVMEQKVQQSHERLLLRTKDLEKSRVQVEKSLQEERELEESLARSKEELTSLTAQNDVLQQRLDEGQAQGRRLYEERMAKLTEGSEAEKAAREAGRKLKALEDKLHEMDLAESRVQYNLQECEDTMLQEFGLTPQRAAEEAEDLPPEEVQGKIRELSEKIKALGPVNPNALQEYEDLKKRHDFMEQQIGDVVQAKENLSGILQEIDATMTAQFKEAFAEIQSYFGDIFVRLFGGGKAELELLDPEDVLHTGVEILVQLPQKKRQNLSALSGGERALTVIALLFSFLRYRPSPFSVLDEIDAPLDEANVARFGSFLREFSQRTQFIVVTHRKGTMEAVDRMYGVTIEDAGVSRILSVKLDDIK